MNIRQQLDTAAINALFRSTNGGISRDIYRRGLRVEAAAKRMCPVNHGRLRSSIITRLVVTNGVVSAEVGTDVSYAMYVHNGTGLYGPHYSRIVPTHATLLKFTVGGRTVYARSVRGQRGNPFLRDALSQAN